jgi:hypothetical protein
MSNEDNPKLSLREKAEELYSMGINRLYFRLLLKQSTLTREDKEYIEKLWKIAEQ